jgi:hypothetical protein
MQIPVIVERLKGNGYRARGSEPFALSAKGSTREEALGKLQDKIRTRLKNGTELVGLEVGTQSDPWLECAGMFKDDPWIADWKQSIEDYRQKTDDDPDAL